MLRLWIVATLILNPVLAVAHDLKHLQLGDSLKSSEPVKNHLWPCRIEKNAGGAFRDGPWIDTAAGTFDKTAKVIVAGNVKWPHSLKVELQGDRRLFSSNSLPDHGTGVYPIQPNAEAYHYDRNPNAIKIQALQFSLNANPTLSEKPSCAPGAVGILLSGVPLFSAIDAGGRDAVAHEVQDGCDGHPQISGVYHYHDVSDCVVDHHKADAHSSLLGYAIDGFGIYGNAGEGGRALTNAELDECHGHVGQIMWDGKLERKYHYHATPQFPYSVGCLRGKFDRQTVRLLSGPPPGWFQ
jgi:YHYH protein